jgi:D-aminoacyl-tRNA deacylase
LPARRTGKKEIRFRDVQRILNDDDEQRPYASQRRFWILSELRKRRLVSLQFEQHSEQSCGHRLVGKNQNLPGLGRRGHVSRRLSVTGCCVVSLDPMVQGAERIDSGARAKYISRSKIEDRVLDRRPPLAPIPRPMRVLLQRVSRAEVRVAGPTGDARVTGRIGPGLVVLVGFTHSDGDEQLAWMADKVLGLRVFGDADDKMNLALSDVDGGALLVVSQFTLYGDARKGRRPSFIDAAPPDEAIPLYERFVALLRARGAHVETGEFGAMMDVELVNHGPVTLWLER